jgi:urea carboxylase
VAAGQDEYASDATLAAQRLTASSICHPTDAPLPRMSRGSVWRIAAAERASVKAGEPTVIAESMKMEIVVAAPCDGRVHKLYCREGAQVAAGQELLVIEASP